MPSLDRVGRISVLFFLFSFPLFLLFSFDVFPFWLRFGLRWQVLCVSGLLSASVLLLRRDFWDSFARWLISSPFVWVTPLLLVWLVVLGFRYGFTGFQSDSITAMSYLAILLPFACFVIRRWVSIFMVRALVLVLIMVVFLESIFLNLYRLVGVGWSQSFIISQIDLPRLFLNTRDGNAVALALGCLSFGLLVRAISSGLDNGVCLLFPSGLFRLRLFAARSCGIVIPLCGLIVVWMNCFLTEGRALLVAMLLPLLVMRLLHLIPSFVWKRLCFMYMCSMSLAIVFDGLLSLLLALLLGVEGGPGGGFYTGLIGIDSGDAGRWALWSSWLRSGLESSIVFGHGLGFEPADYLPPGSWPSDPHNIFISIIADSGLLGFGIITASVFGGIRDLSRLRILREPVFVFSLIAFLVFSSFSAVYGWSSGVWSTLVVLILASSPVFCLVHKEVRCQYPAPADFSSVRASMSYVGVAVVSVLCTVQIFVVTSKQLLAIPRFLLDMNITS